MSFVYVDALFIGLGVGLTIFVLLAVFVVMAVLIKRGHLCTWKVVHEGEAFLKSYLRCINSLICQLCKQELL